MFFHSYLFCSNPEWCGNQARDSISAPGADRSGGARAHRDLAAWIHSCLWCLEVMASNGYINLQGSTAGPNFVQTGAPRSDSH